MQRILYYKDKIADVYNIISSFVKRNHTVHLLSDVIIMKPREFDHSLWTPCEVPRFQEERKGQHSRMIPRDAADHDPIRS